MREDPDRHTTLLDYRPADAKVNVERLECDWKVDGRIVLWFSLAKVCADS